MKDKKVFISADDFREKSAFIGTYDSAKALPIKDSKEMSCIYKAKIEELDRSVSDISSAIAETNSTLVSTISNIDERISKIDEDTVDISAAVLNVSSSVSELQESLESAIVEIDGKISDLNEIESTIDEVQNSVSTLSDSIDSVLSSTEDTINAISELKDKAAIVDFKLSSFYQNFVRQNEDASLQNLYVEREAGKIERSLAEQISLLYGKKIYGEEDTYTIDPSKYFLLRYFGIDDESLIGVGDFNFSITVSSLNEEQEYSEEEFSIDNGTISLEDMEDPSSSIVKYSVDSEHIPTFCIDRRDISKISVYVQDDVETYDLIDREDESSEISSFNEFVTVNQVEEAASQKIDDKLSSIKEQIASIDFLSNDAASYENLDSLYERCDTILGILKSL